MLEHLVAILALAVLAIGVIGMARPVEIVRVWGRWRSPRRQVLHALARVAFGTLLAAAAPQTRAPEAVYWLGILFFASGVLALLLRPATFWSFVSWGLRQSTRVIRMESALAAATGGFLAWATLG